MNKYEIMYILNPNLDVETLKKQVKDFEKVFIDNRATITLSKELGQKEFAYEIKNFKNGFYFLYNLESKDDKAIKEFDRLAKINENVIRHLIINQDK